MRSTALVQLRKRLCRQFSALFVLFVSVACLNHMLLAFAGIPQVLRLGFNFCEVSPVLSHLRINK